MMELDYTYEEFDQLWEAALDPILNWYMEHRLTMSRQDAQDLAVQKMEHLQSEINGTLPETAEDAFARNVITVANLMALLLMEAGIYEEKIGHIRTMARNIGLQVYPDSSERSARSDESKQLKKNDLAGSIFFN